MTQRTTNTPHRLAHALTELCQTMPFDKITVKNIAETCGVSVRTFYTHFEDKYDLVAWLFSERNRRNFEETFLPTRDYRAYSLASINGFMGKEAYHRNLVNNTHGRYALRVIVRQRMYELFSNFIRSEFGAGALDSELDFILRYYMSFCTDALIDWYMGGMELDPQAMVRLTCNEIMPARLRPYLLPASGGDPGPSARCDAFANVK